jgi:predicted RNA-binding protein with RPS1 domain
VDKNLGLYVGLGSGISGLIWSSTLPGNFDINNGFKVGKKIKVKLLRFKEDKYQVDLGLVERR